MRPSTSLQESLSIGSCHSALSALGREHRVAYRPTAVMAAVFDNCLRADVLLKLRPMADYLVSGYAEARAALVWVGMSAPAFRHGLTLDQIFTGLEHGYQSVRARLTDSERIRQWEQSRQKMQEAYALFKAGKVLEGNARSRKQRSRSRRCGESKDGRFRGRSSVTPSTAAMSWTRTDGPIHLVS